MTSAPHPATSDLTAREVRNLLGLEPHPTCGYVNLSFVSPLTIVPGGLPEPFADGRPAGSALYFQVTQDRPVHLHQLRNDQLYHHYLGGPIDVLILLADGTHRVERLGSDLRHGERPQLLVPGGSFHTARLAHPGDEWFLGASTEWPGVDPDHDVVQPDLDQLRASHPEAADLIDSFTSYLRT